jgi:hypothetical protein
MIIVLFTGCGVLKQYSYTKVIKVNNLTKNEIYANTNMWFINYFNSPQHVIQFQDKEEGKIGGKYHLYMAYHNGAYNYKNVTLLLDMKDEKIRFKCNFLYKTTKLSNKAKIDLYNTNFDSLTNSLKNYLDESSVNW